MSIYEDALEFHKRKHGKLKIDLKMPLEKNEDLQLAYTPGVASPCIEIAKDKSLVYDYTWKQNSVAVVSDGSAVLGLGNIGPDASLPVMEGKAMLYKVFCDVDAVPICLDTQDTEEIIRTCKLIAPSFGGIHLEDISAPRCVEIERRLIEELDIPVFHDDQHGTAIVVVAGLMNALKIVKKKKEDINVVISGTGAAGSSIIKMLHLWGVRNILGFNINGIINKEDYDSYDFLSKELSLITNPNNVRVSLKEAMDHADVFIGVSAANLLTKEMVASMNQDAIVFAMANPNPEISYQDAKDANARIVGTGRSDSPNQINNVLAFPGLFKAALDVRATVINEEMKLAASIGIANLVSEEELSEEYIIPTVLDKRVSDSVIKVVKEVAYQTGVARV